MKGDFEKLLKDLKFDLEALGFGQNPEVEVNGGDTVELMSQYYEEIVSAISGTSTVRSPE